MVGHGHGGGAGGSVVPLGVKPWCGAVHYMAGGSRFTTTVPTRTLEGTYLGTTVICRMLLGRPRHGFVTHYQLLRA